MARGNPGALGNQNRISPVLANSNHIPLPSALLLLLFYIFTKIGSLGSTLIGSRTLSVVVKMIHVAYALLAISAAYLQKSVV